MRGQIIFILLLPLLLLLTVSALSAQELKEMEFREVPNTVIIDQENRAVLIIESTIPGINFSSNKGVIPGTFKEKEPGVWQAQVYPGVQLISIRAEGYLPILNVRHNFPPRLTWWLKVTPKVIIPPEGRGNITIETNPPGASVAFNNIPLPNITPLTLEDQPAGKHSIRLEKEGYGTLEETITVEKDKTVTKRFTLQKEYAGIKVTSDPPDATVYLDGDRLGETPLERNDISPGAGTLSLELEGYESNTQQVRLVAGQTKIFHVDLFRQTGSVSITANPYGAEVFLDGERLGVYKGTAFKRDKLNLGMHTARAVLDGYDDALESFNVMYNKTSQIELRPKAQPGSLFIMSTPSGASIIINDRDTNKNTSAKIDGLSAGEHDLILLLQGYGDVRKTVTVSPGKTETVNETLKETPQKIAGSSTLEEQKVTSPPPRKEPVSKFRSKIHRGITRKGFKLGFNLSKLVGADWSKNAKYKMGFCGGFFITYSFNKWFEIQPEILYTQKGEKYKDDYEESTEEFDYIEIPILTKFNFGIIKPIIGPAIAVNTRAKYKFEYYWTGQSGEVDETSHINSPDIGLILGAELSFGKFIFDARYNMGLIYVFKGFGWDNAKNSVFSSMMGYSF